MLANFLKQISFLNPKIASIFYIIYTVILSITFTYVQLPDSFFNQSDNFLNVYFMKYSYCYAVVILLPFTCILHYVLNYGDLMKSLLSLLRVFIFAFVNFCVGEEFNILGVFFGACDMYSYLINDKVECISSGYNWTKLDISGHAFHIIYSILVILEELSFLKNWRNIERTVTEKCINYDTDYDDNPVTEDSRGKFKTFTKLFYRYNTFLKIFLVLLTWLMILLHLSIFVTLIYFHTAFEKIVAGIIAVVFWFITYHLIYPITGFKTGPYSIRSAEHDGLLGKSSEFNLISGEVVDYSSADFQRKGVFTLFVRNSKTYDVL